MILLGVDIGFGFTKVTSGEKSLIFKSLVGEAADIQFHTNIGDGSFIKNLHVTIGGKSYFVGDYAEQQSNNKQFTLDNDQLIAEFAKILALTAMGIYSEKSDPINVVSGLPVGYLKQNRKRFTDILTGNHTVTYHNPDGTQIARKITVNEIQMLPQPVGTVFNLLLNDRGEIASKELTKQKIGVVDIGFRTTDFAILDQMKYVDRGSCTIETGISTSFTEIANRLQEMSGVTIALYRMYKAAEIGSITIRGQNFNISGLRDQSYALLAGKIAEVINRLWAEDWDIDTIFLTGGGSKELVKYLQPLIPGNVLTSENNGDLRLNNAQGYVKYGRHKWRQE
jgi:plasmid segregation protein ParM